MIARTVEVALDKLSPLIVRQADMLLALCRRTLRSRSAADLRLLLYEHPLGGGTKI
ncbi:hypothetical protein HMPREF0063_10428 [Aeromicrobium marinum DSM 15272]|uniref:Uncharacterized protein n=1 Tax=Aeromicrobium marinum DSM 15272 TaxID=585531 RepID=E2S8S1_9ACTN|nr:hypothetical protein [Aeromicrobium marinum]EFQ84576.1 hypothetical protein HMPREF0063_10428 [Aeromicrobium marinum DSM 15272]